MQQKYQRAQTQARYDYHAVCHCRHLVNPDTGAYIQNLETALQTFKVEVWWNRGN